MNFINNILSILKKQSVPHIYLDANKKHCINLNKPFGLNLMGYESEGKTQYLNRLVQQLSTFDIPVYFLSLNQPFLSTNNELLTKFKTINLISSNLINEEQEIIDIIRYLDNKQIEHNFPLQETTTLTFLNAHLNIFEFQEFNNTESISESYILNMFFSFLINNKKTKILFINGTDRLMYSLHKNIKIKTTQNDLNHFYNQLKKSNTSIIQSLNTPELPYDAIDSVYYPHQHSLWNKTSAYYWLNKHNTGDLQKVQLAPGESVLNFKHHIRLLMEAGKKNKYITQNNYFYIKPYLLAEVEATMYDKTIKQSEKIATRVKI